MANRVSTFVAAIAVTLGAALATASPASAALVSVTTLKGSASDYSAFRAAESAFWAGKTLTYSEDFENHEIMEEVPAIDSAVGTFTSTLGGQRGQEISILDAANTPFGGRYNVSNDLAGSGKWLDSNDSKEIVWDVSGLTAFDTISFWMTDVLDVAGKLSFQTTTGATYDTSITFPGAGGSNRNGSLFFISMSFDEAITSFKWSATARNDGWGLDDIKIGSAVPLPAAVWFMLTALGGLAGLRWMNQNRLAMAAA
ncbi:VPLPA-CTERM sorting domain-containing protein [uncultured Rhodospira sp.]|uniref:VPLPA-CTERM sorting domain-containing protein n=1 Tax=uncultured Rhodospira sp. TaxID=1936189 RepID=UPI00260712EC|nr:VPLPA-CTERM sorting domain-containing protein [uncultured Rhodospira sp.]